jgi:beta-lactamase superfamily II metal-dependent hydrolase
VGFTVDFIDVGGGDATLIRTGGRTLLIDTGLEETGGELVRTLQELGVQRIDYLLITHFDKDHVGGVGKLVASFDVLNIIQPVYVKEQAKFYTKYKSAVAQSGARVTDLTAPSALTLGGQVFSIYPPEKAIYEEGDNDFSLVVKAIYGEVGFLFAGDVEADRLKEMLGKDVDWSATVLKCPHHGRYNKRSEAFLEAVNPSYVVIPDSGAEPASEQILSLLTQRNCTFWRTSEVGSVQIYTDGQSVTVNP